MMRSDSFGDFISQNSQETSTEALFDRFTSVMGSYGYDRLIFSVPRDPDLPEHLNQIGLFHRYPEDWHKFYLEKDFARIDPVLKCAATYDFAFQWSDLERDLPLSKAQVKFMRLGEEAGLNNGVGIPLRGKGAQIAGVALATSHKQDECLKDLDLINAYCTWFYTAYKRLNAKSKPSLPITLTPQEREILMRVATGRTDDEIGAALNISRNTVDSHMRHIFRKLDVNSRVAASVRGIMIGVIHP
ncbi:helix-turn-helix transcriptional regulator [Asticcacaulis machinosus]|uniref:LuxR family transcriptional regulator n=1 Tax=Asticcacaulis machinosus TaxID=2984211 RepID=A0ABT5HGE3_9CAUL|nr:LuxR family transcriptional regulator [Asticcacaulis machinosus]MDC7675205.1 LuxR family transcriptional regulator [Asticcacaulis machinosus]